MLTSHQLGFLLCLLIFPNLLDATSLHLTSIHSSFGEPLNLDLHLTVKVEQLVKYEFILRQQTGDEKLKVKYQDNERVKLLSQGKILDPNAIILVRYQKQTAQWKEVTKLSIFTVNPPSDLYPPLLLSRNNYDVNDDFSDKHSSKANHLVKKKVCYIERQASDTLWQLAKRYAILWDTNIYAVIIGIFETNPKAFANGKLNSLMPDKQLICPAIELLNQFKDKDLAKAHFKQLVG